MAAKIAIALSLAAVITVGIAVVVVVTREAPVAIAAPPPPPVQGEQTQRFVVNAGDVVKLDREAIEVVSSGGIKVIDSALRKALSLEASDVITLISGKPIKRQFDVYDALLAASMMNATVLYIEITRAGTSTLVRWELEGDLRAARNRGASRRP